MRTLLLTASALLLSVGLASESLAQTQLVRGDIDGIQGTRRFRLQCSANIELVSNTVNLQQLHDASRQQNIEYDMQVTDVSVGGNTILNVVSAVAIPEMLSMGNLRFGRSETWEVFAPSGSPVAVYVNLTANTTYLPLGDLGTWILGSPSVLFRAGNSVGGQFRFNFTMPTMPELVGTSFTSQALFAAGNDLVITNPDCKAVRAD